MPTLITQEISPAPPSSFDLVQDKNISLVVVPPSYVDFFETGHRFKYDSKKNLFFVQALSSVIDRADLDTLHELASSSTTFGSPIFRIKYRPKSSSASGTKVDSIFKSIFNDKNERKCIHSSLRNKKVSVIVVTAENKNSQHDIIAGVSFSKQYVQYLVTNDATYSAEHYHGGDNKPWRRRGLARFLLRLVQACNESLSLEQKLALKPSEDNELIKFYAKLGFTELEKNASTEENAPEYPGYIEEGDTWNGVRPPGMICMECRSIISAKDAKTYKYQFSSREEMEETFLAIPSKISKPRKTSPDDSHFDWEGPMHVLNCDDCYSFSPEKFEYNICNDQSIFWKGAVDKTKWWSANLTSLAPFFCCHEIKHPPNLIVIPAHVSRVVLNSEKTYHKSLSDKEWVIFLHHAEDKHYQCLVCNRLKRFFVLYDGFEVQSTKAEETIRLYLDRFELSSKRSSWKYDVRHGVSKQTNIHDCGPICSMNAVLAILAADDRRNSEMELVYVSNEKKPEPSYSQEEKIRLAVVFLLKNLYERYKPLIFRPKRNVKGESLKKHQEASDVTQDVEVIVLSDSKSSELSESKISPVGTRNLPTAQIMEEVQEVQESETKVEEGKSSMPVPVIFEEPVPEEGTEQSEQPVVEETKNQEVLKVAEFASKATANPSSEARPDVETQHPSDMDESSSTSESSSTDSEPETKPETVASAIKLKKKRIHRQQTGGKNLAHLLSYAETAHEEEPPQEEENTQEEEPPQEEDHESGEEQLQEEEHKNDSEPGEEKDSPDPEDSNDDSSDDSSDSSSDAEDDSSIETADIVKTSSSTKQKKEAEPDTEKSLEGDQSSSSEESSPKVAKAKKSKSESDSDAPLVAQIKKAIARKKTVDSSEDEDDSDQKMPAKAARDQLESESESELKMPAEAITGEKKGNKEGKLPS